MFTQEEKTFLINLIHSLSIKPAEQEATNAVRIVHSLLEKLSKTEE